MALSTGGEARRRLRWGAFGLAVVVGVVALGSDPADARKRRKRPAYNPPYASIVVDANTGAVLQATNADSSRHPASLTKIMTLYLLFERLESGRLKLSSQLPVSAHAAAQAPTKLGLKPGQSLKVEDAILALVTKSANDAAVVVAEAIGGTESEFARMMTRKARSLGMRRTTYTNASGLPDSDQITTARDQALLGRAVQERFPRYYRYFATEAFAFHGRRMRNHNRLLGRVEGVDGIKTGYTRASGFNLLTSMRRGRRHVVAVVLGGRSAGRRDAQMQRLLSAHIMTASTRRTSTVLAKVRQEQRISLANVAVPLPPDKPDEIDTTATAEATASIQSNPLPEIAAQPNRPTPGSTSPITPLLVKTVTIKPKSRTGSSATHFAPVPPREAVNSVPLPPTPPAAAEPPSRALAAMLDETRKTSQEAEKKSVANKPMRSGWMIQVGAFDEEKEAKVRLSSAHSRAKKLLADADPFTEAVTKGKKTLYRARFAGLEKNQAVAACRALRRRDIACLPLKH